MIAASVWELFAFLPYKIYLLLKEMEDEAKAKAKAKAAAKAG
jgi:hypothetical protein